MQYRIFLAAMAIAAILPTIILAQSSATGTIDGHEYVDLGLSVKWATCNIGADKPKDWGDRFAWGETKTKEIYNRENCAMIGDGSLFSGNRFYDTATNKWGKAWRMPSEIEFQELIDKCTWDYSPGGGAKITGPNGNSIYIPYAACLAGENGKLGNCCYWSSEAFWTSGMHDKAFMNECALALCIYMSFNDEKAVGYCPRYFGLPVRPVSDALTTNELTPATDTIDGHGYVDLGLSVMWATCNIGASSPNGYGDYFAWGEAETKSYFQPENSMTWEKNNRNFRDAATINWGHSWRTPKEPEMRELIDSCTWLWRSVDGVEGMLVTGPNGNNIFLPAAGQGIGDVILCSGDELCYWSSSLNYEGETFDGDTDEVEKQKIEYENEDWMWMPLGLFSYDRLDVDRCDAYYGFTIRPVTNVKPANKQKKRKK